MMWCIYLAGLVIMAVIMVFSLSEELPKDYESKGIDRAFDRMSFYLYRRFAVRNKFIRKMSVRRNLNIIYPDEESDETEKKYYADKIKTALIIFFAGCILAAFIDISERNSSKIDDDGLLMRNSYLEGSVSEEMLLKNENGDYIGEYRVDISEREYTDQQARKLLSEMSPLLPDIVKGTNPSIDQIREDIVLPDAVDGYPFEIDWTIDNHDVIHSDGSVQNVGISQNGEAVTLTAECSYRDVMAEVVIHALVLPKIITPQDKAEKEIYDAVKKNDKETITKEYMKLPGKIGRQQVIWSKSLSNNSMVLFVLAICAAVAAFTMKDQDLRKKIDMRKESLSSEYPQFVSKLVLYMGAGMTLRNIIFRMTDKFCIHNTLPGNDSNAPEQGKSERTPLMTELCRIRYEMVSGVSEATAFEHLCERCGVQEYTRLCNLLIQNMRKGNSGLLPLLREESEKATDKRLDNARKAGEQASTKLLMPMMMMLAIVMVLIMIPAHMSF